ITAGVRGADPGGVPAVVLIVIAVGVVAVAVRLGELVAAERAGGCADDRAEGLVAMAGDDVAEDSADPGAGDGGDDLRRALLLAGHLGPGPRTGDRRNEDDRRDTRREKVFTHEGAPGTEWFCSRCI